MTKTVKAAKAVKAVSALSAMNYVFPGEVPVVYEVGSKSFKGAFNTPVVLRDTAGNSRQVMAEVQFFLEPYDYKQAIGGGGLTLLSFLDLNKPA